MKFVPLCDSIAPHSAWRLDDFVIVCDEKLIWKLLKSTKILEIN